MSSLKVSENTVDIRKQPPEVFYKKLLLKVLQYSLENTCVGVSFK